LYFFAIEMDEAQVRLQSRRLTFQRGEKTVGPVLDVVVREHPEQRVVPLTPLSESACPMAATTLSGS
jgi:hypothetical protein